MAPHLRAGRTVAMRGSYPTGAVPADEQPPKGRTEGKEAIINCTTLAGTAVASAIALAVPVTQPMAYAPAVAATVEEITRALRGKVCTTEVGGTFTFGADGQYGYSGLWGLWTISGRFQIADGVIIVTLDDDFRRWFAILRHGNDLYVDQAALSCGPRKPIQA